jgi:hypothetical protein
MDSEITYGKVLIKSGDISVFTTGNSRSANDSANKKREVIIYLLLKHRIPEAWFANQEWTKLRDNLYDYINGLYEDPRIVKVQFFYRAGRNYNYDFELRYFAENFELLKTIKLEYKHNCSKLNSYPQFLSSAANSFVLGQCYAQYFYENYIGQIAELYNIPPPNKKEYMKFVYNSSYDKHEFFQELKEKEDEHIEDKKKIVKESIKQFLLLSNRIDVDKLKKKLKDSQTEKVFMLYKNGKFYRDEITQEEITITTFSGIKNGNTLVFNTQNKKTQIKILLRWKNHAGILYPAWQIGLKR